MVDNIDGCALLFIGKIYDLVIGDGHWGRRTRGPVPGPLVPRGRHRDECGRQAEREGPGAELTGAPAGRNRRGSAGLPVQLVLVLL